MDNNTDLTPETTPATEPQMNPGNAPQGKPKFDLKEFFVTLPAKIKVFWKNPPKGRYLNLKEILCLGGTAFGVSTIITIVSGLITATQIPGIYDIDVIHGAWICFLSSIIGLIIQPVFGKLIQNTNTKYGKYKPFILVLAPILAVFAIAATWQPQGMSEDARTIYAYLICTPTLIIWNLVQNTFYLLPGVITPNQQERADVWSPIGLVIGFSPTIMNVLGNVIKAHFNDLGQEYMAYRYLGFIYAAVGLVLLLCLFKVKERVIPTVENKEKVGLIEGMRMIMKNKPLLIFTLALVLGSSRTVVEIDAEVIGRLRYGADIATGLEVFGALTLITGFAVTPNMILLPLMTRKMNNRTILMIWMGCNAFGYLLLGLIGLQNIPQGTVSAVVITLLRFISLFNALASLQPLMMAELSDYQQYLTGKRLEGFIQTFLYALVLVFTNAGLVVMAYVKQGMDYQPSYFYGGEIPPTQTQINNALDYFNIAFIVSAVSAALMLITLFFYTLNKKQHEKIVAALAEKSRAEGAYNLDEEVGKTSIGAITEDEAAAIMGVSAIGIIKGNDEDKKENSVEATEEVTEETTENETESNSEKSENAEDADDPSADK